MMRLAVCFSILLLAFGGCKKPAGSHSASQEKPNASPISRDPVGPKFDACRLLTKEEIQAIQGSAITDTKSSESAAGVFRVSQCYFAATEPNRSVSLSVTQANAGVKGKHSPRDYWNETFGRFGGSEKGSESDKEKKESLREQREKGEEEKATPPKKITGIGEDAYWIGNRVGGSLYVLKKDKDAFIRISVGGSDKEEGKIDKSKALAQKALDRL